MWLLFVLPGTIYGKEQFRSFQISTRKMLFLHYFMVTTSWKQFFFLYFFGLIHGSNFGFYILTLISLQDLGSGSQSAYWISGTFFLLLLIVVRFWYFGNKELNQCLQVETLYFGRQKNHLLLLSKVVLWKSREKKLMSDHDPPTSIVSHFVSHGIKLACLPYLAYVLYSQLL